MRLFFLAATAVLALGLSHARAESKAIENMPKEPRYEMPEPVQATAEAPESAAGKTLLFSYPSGAGIRSRNMKTGDWSPWTKLVAATKGNFKFDDRNTHTVSSGGGGIKEYRSTVTYKKISKGEALVTKETVGVGHSYKCTTTYRLVFTSPGSGTAFARTVGDGQETELTHLHFTLE